MIAVKHGNIILNIRRERIVKPENNILELNPEIHRDYILDINAENKWIIATALHKKYPKYPDPPSLLFLQKDNIIAEVPGVVLYNSFILG